MKIKINEENDQIDRNSRTWRVMKNICMKTNQEEAFYVCDLKEIIEKHKIWQKKLPKVEPHYAVKCNDDMAILEILASLGVSFDCASQIEINKTLSVIGSNNSDRIIFANPAKPISHIKYAKNVGVSKMTFDNESELYKIEKVYPTANLVIRIRIDATDAQCPLGMKFGCDPIKEAPNLLEIAKSLNLNVIGVSFHVGSGCREPAVFRRAISAAKDIFNYAETLGYRFNLLDIGGGYPGVKGSSINEIANVVNTALNDFFFKDLPNIRIIAEPGRFYVSSAYTLACNIHSIRKIHANDAQGAPFETHRMYYINDGVYGSFNCILYDHQVVNAVPLRDINEQINNGNNNNKKRISSSVWGPTCDGLDQVIEETFLPDMNIGDWLIFEDMGAYTLPVASPFNGFPIPEVYYVMNAVDWPIFKKILSIPERNVQFDNESLAEQHELYNLKIPAAKTANIALNSFAAVAAPLLLG